MNRTNKDFGKTLEARTKEFASEIIDLSLGLPDFPEARVIRYQLTKSGTSIGANYREANRSRSKRDFQHKIKICESESFETGYWLEIIEEKKWSNDPDLLAASLREAREFLALFTSIGSKLRK